MDKQSLRAASALTRRAAGRLTLPPGAARDYFRVFWRIMMILEKSESNQEIYNAAMDQLLKDRGIGPSALAARIALLATALLRITMDEHDPTVEDAAGYTSENETHQHGIEGCDCAAWIAAKALEESGLWKRPVRLELMGPCVEGKHEHENCSFEILNPEETLRCTCPGH